MRISFPLLALALLSLLPPCPAEAAFLGPSATNAPASSLRECADAEEMTTCVLSGHIVRREHKNRYTFESEGGQMIVDIPPHVFGQLDVRPEQTVRLTGEVGGKRHPERMDTHLRVRYIEVLP
ncbi:NirD/YgiW/YdeI family stress tolerance protein [uncultured Desulfovibrio sp.]|uniref:NirD/YgiW/YdeI family stress tolerance protein n=1 Tax=Candidatus Desulfovibrio intestinavium TaxID=2838534 RepID=A0A9D2HMJ6_9BACT|nr:NirD/YgiW/YdeI family stress tolerance protein [uncultured Desulfovibrio sp.]HJA78228.1 NirD/YgiW/YdeI family stress tolerance protein [Candidatus Desulfovibrio intestinavium]